MRWTAALVLALIACGDPTYMPIPDAMPDAVVDVCNDAGPTMPATLAETGLCLDAGCTQMCPNAIPYKPRWELWSDGATKRRWIKLPPGAKIDTSNMDFWDFPVGTKLWKEFTRDNIRVETRLVMRVGSGTTVQDWFYAAYVWNPEQTNAVWEELGVVNANGTQHDVPSKQMCRACHENLKPARVLGFGALQLDYDDTTAGEINLADLVAQDKLTNPPSSGSGVGGFFPLPGDTTNVQPALGYMHANCGHCHNPNSTVYTNGQTLMELRLTVGALGTLAATRPYQTAVGVTATLPVGGRTIIAKPGMPGQSTLVYRFESVNPSEHMPALGSEVMDPTGQATLTNWIMNIP